MPTEDTEIHLDTSPHKKYFSRKELLLITTCGALVLALYFIFTYLQKQQVHLDQQNKMTAETIAKIEQEITDIKTELSMAQDSATEKTKGLEDKIANIKPTIINNTTSVDSSSDYSAIVGKWQNRVAKVNCVWKSADGKVLEKNLGSATLVTLPGKGTTAVTNKHVLMNSDESLPASCSVEVYGVGSRTVTRSTTQNPFSLGSGDWGYISLSAPSSASDNHAFDMTVVTPLTACTNTVTVGDKIVVLGYPSIGTSSGITATEGIISGLEGDYYVTSAKIDFGNSGGAAIQVKNGCYLGIPTYVERQKGGLESLGRILKGSLVLN